MENAKHEIYNRAIVSLKENKNDLKQNISSAKVTYDIVYATYIMI